MTTALNTISQQTESILALPHLQLVDEDRDLHGHLLVALHHQVVGEGCTIDPVHHQHIHILCPEKSLGQLLHPGRLTAQRSGSMSEGGVRWQGEKGR